MPKDLKGMLRNKESYILCYAIKTQVHHHHHQPINVPTAGAQAFFMDYPQGERTITHHAGPVRIGGLNG
jgi:hypothetical protein